MDYLLSFFCILLFLAGLTKASTRTHDPENLVCAEYLAGFILCFGSAIGFYNIWW